MALCHLPNGCQIAHGQARVKRPFSDLPSLEMHEMELGISAEELNHLTQEPAASDRPNLARAFHGQLGFIPFTVAVRLPRHVHISPPAPSFQGPKRLVTERILVLNGVAMVELNGLFYVIPPGSLVTIAAGVPHTWTACPRGVKLPDGGVSDGQFLMVYEYEEPTGFFPTSNTDTVYSVEGYVRYEGDLDKIRFPALTASEVIDSCKLIWETKVLGLQDINT